MSVHFPSAHAALLRIASANAAGDAEAPADASAILISLSDHCEREDDGFAGERLLRFLLDVTVSPMPEAESVRALLGSCVLEVLPRLLRLAAASPAAALCAQALVERRLAAGAVAAPGSAAAAADQTAAVCSPRELLTALLELYDIQKDVAFDSPLHLLLLRLLGLMPLLVAAVQRRRLQVAQSCLAAVADLAAAAAPRLAAARAAAAAAAAAAARSGGGSHCSGVARSGGMGDDEDEDVATEMWEAVEAQLVAPFVDFAQHLHQRVLSSELPALHIAAAAAADAPGADASSASPPHSHSSERLCVAAWLLAVVGALWPAWDSALPAAAGGGGGGGGSWGWCGTRGAATLLGLLLGTYLPSLPPPPPRQQQPRRQRGNAEVSSCSSGGVVSWMELWVVAEAAGADSNLEVASDRELTLLGAATVMWLAATAAAATPFTAAAAAATTAGQQQVEGACSRDRVSARGSSCCPPAPEPPADDRLGALMVLCEACQVLLRRAGRENSAVLLTRALQLLATGCAQVRHTATAGVASTKLTMSAETAAANAPGWHAVDVSVAAPATDPWVAIARQLTTDRPASDETGVTAEELYDMLVPYEPHLLDEREAALEPLVRNLTTVAAVNVAHGSLGSEGDAARALAHSALQSLLSAVPSGLRALSLSRLAGGPSPEVSALALQRLQGEVATACGAGGSSSVGADISVFSHPWIIRPVLQQLLPLLPAPRAASMASAAPAATPAATDAAAAAIIIRADAATAAVSLLRFLALRSRATATAATGAVAAASARVAFAPDRPDLAIGTTGLRAPEGGNGAIATGAAAAVDPAEVAKADGAACFDGKGASAAPSSAAARATVLSAVYDAAVLPLYGIISTTLVELRRQVKLEEDIVAAKLPEASQPLPPPRPATTARAAGSVGDVGLGGAGASQAGGHRFASNVAAVSEAVGALTALSRLQQVADWLGEALRGRGQESPSGAAPSPAAATAAGAVAGRPAGP